MGWKTYVAGRVERLEDELRRLNAESHATADYAVACRALRDARFLADMAKMPSDIRAPAQALSADTSDQITKPAGCNWWNGDTTEQAYAALHRADAAYIALAPDEILRELAVSMSGRLTTSGFGIDDPRPARYRSELELVADLKRTTPTAPETRSEMRQIVENIDLSSDGQHYQARVYRNILFTTALGLLLLFLVFSIVASLNPTFFSLCGPAANGSGVTCPGGAKPGSGDLFLLGFAGMVGGSLGALLLLLTVNVSGQPFTPTVPQALLKLPAGAITALVGLFVLQHGALGILKAQPGDSLVGWAILFGLAQQAVTQAVDARASALLSGSGGKTGKASVKSAKG